ncbi:hypothetical protein BABINDRAFT_161372 [Babjeviella inositovora NRRL Y-12698]|uniref:Uncharacterized protein n=1 Tax=Babjeviella inositovora NRRL Y-12698 TaxID=984486 RepID=A0A1E3QRV8_9ASCO|nr:uncharacterized protein BABINDRAFT_161372 [Babjeviella inositovora NRRL Y-12698]ODQ80433.1 hypothetical protein BABINDRAFT_161372 [Babjeviella inositovora NRRL Y-12698]
MNETIADIVRLPYIDEVALRITNAFFNLLTTTYNPKHWTSALFLALALGIIVLGSFSSVERPHNALPPNRDHPLFDQSDKDITILHQEEQTITVKHAALVPIIGGTTLMGLYLGIRYLTPEQLSKALNYYVIFVSFAASSRTYSFAVKLSVRNVAHWLGFDSLKVLERYRLTFSIDDEINPSGLAENEKFQHYNETAKADKEAEETSKPSGSCVPEATNVSVPNQIFNYYFSSADLLAVPLAFATSYVYYHYHGNQNFILSNVIGINFAVYGIQIVKLGSFKAGVVLLFGLFLYDIYFVFGTDVMMTVATKLDIPAKLMLPNISIDGAANTQLAHDIADGKLTSLKDLPVAILGLGDIVVPGMFIALCLRFDLWKYHQFTSPGTEFHHLNSYAKPYFVSSLVGYAVGMIATMVVLHLFETGQPALLYLVPGVVGAVLISALCKGDLQLLWNFKDGEDTPDMESDSEAPTLADLLDEEYNEEEDEDYTEDDNDGDTVILYDSEEEEIVALSDEEIEFFRQTTVITLRS